MAYSRAETGRGAGVALVWAVVGFWLGKKYEAFAATNGERNEVAAKAGESAG